MKDSKEKENRISNLKNMFDHMNDEEEPNSEMDEYDDIEEDEELINFLNEGRDDYELNDEFIYRPGKDSPNVINLEEDDSEIDEDFIIETDINEKLDKKSQIVNEPHGFENEINENFDNMVNMKIGEKPILAIISLILGIIFIVASILVYNAGTDRIVDNVVSGENPFLVVSLIIIGALLVIYGLLKLLNVKNPFESMFESMNEDNNKLNKVEEKEEPSIPKSNIPLDKESYKIGEFDMDELKSTLKKSFSKTIDTPEIIEENIDIKNIPPAREKNPDEKGLIKEEIEEKDYEQARLDGESIDEIFADVEDLKKEDK